jgi:hypothetical protein
VPPLPVNASGPHPPNGAGRCCLGSSEVVVSGKDDEEQIASINIGIMANSYECAYMTPGSNFPGASYVPGEQPIMSISSGVVVLDVDRYNSPSARRDLLGRYSNPQEQG